MGMAPYKAPLSTITAASLIDLGYELGGESVDEYFVPDPRPSP